MVHVCLLLHTVATTNSIECKFTMADTCQYTTAGNHYSYQWTLISKFSLSNNNQGMLAYAVIAYSLLLTVIIITTKIIITKTK